MSSAVASANPSPMIDPRCMARATASVARAPIAWATIGSRAMSVPTPKIDTLKKYKFPSATAARTVADTRPTISVSTSPIAVRPNWTTTTGTASAIVARNSARPSLAFVSMRVRILVTVATLLLARDSVFAQSGSIMAQAIPVVTRADPTVGHQVLTEGYVTQPLIMADGSRGAFQGVGTLNLEGLTLKRGELTTGAYGEGYVDRRHPHAYIHELLVGAEEAR